MPFEQFLPDYFAECEQHLAAIRRVLLEFDELPAGASPDGARVQDLLRALHTLKGLSGMVGLVPAEQLAHGLEDALRDWQRAGGSLEPARVQALFTGAGLIEACIAAKRDQVEPPPVVPFLESLRHLLSQATSPAGDGAARATGSAGASPPAIAAPSRRYVFEFRPSTELAGQGIGVESVRARLTELGRLRDAKPRVDAAGGIVFEFDVDVPIGRTPDDAWRAEGMGWSTRDESATAPPAGVPPGDGGGRAASADSAPLALGSVLRVDVARVDELMRMIGELVVTRARLADALAKLPGQRAGADWEGVQESATLIERQLRALREGVMRIRLVQVGELFERMRFAVRELARETGKRVRLDVRGQETEIDKMVVERMLEPLLHLIRNAVSHGIEAPEDRIAAGKPAEGRLTLAAAASGDRITLTVEDDGAGIDRAGVAARAAERGLVAAGGGASGAELDPVSLMDILCRPGFSMREEADLASGRGVGMAVVASAVRDLGGDIALDSELGRGTRFRIELPLTLMIVDALLVELAGQIMAVPQPVLREVFQLDAGGVTPVGRHEVVAYRGGVLPLVRLRSAFGLPAAPAATGAVLVVGTASQPAGLVVDRLLGLREIVVHPLTDPLVVLRGIAGATELGDGRIALVLDASALVQAAREGASDGGSARAQRSPGSRGGSGMAEGAER